MRVLRSTAYRRMPWKNGGGETLEIAVSPAGASLDAFDWRISMAIVTGDGPFSSFPGIDRTLSILEGEGIALTVDAAPCTLTRASAPFRFAADVPAGARLLGGTVTDLNVMTRRARCRHQVRRIGPGTVDAIDTSAEVAVVFCVEGQATCAIPAAEPLVLGARDCALLAAPGRIGITLQPGATLLLVEIYRTAVTAG